MTSSEDLSTAAFDALSEADATAALATCLDAAEWTGALVRARPYRSLDALERLAMGAARSLPDAALAQALAAHPRIGERPAGPGAVAAFSRAEQSGVPDDTSTATQLHEANLAYEERFGRVFLIRATGRDAAAILAEARRRLGNDPATEAAEVRDQLGEIAVLRLRQLVTTPLE